MNLAAINTSLVVFKLQIHITKAFCLSFPSNFSDYLKQVFKILLAVLFQYYILNQRLPRRGCNSGLKKARLENKSLCYGQIGLQGLPVISKSIQGLKVKNLKSF